MKRRALLTLGGAAVICGITKARRSYSWELERQTDARNWPKVKTFVETFNQNDGHWLPWRCELRHDAIKHRMLLKPTRTDGAFYCWTGTARPGQRYDYGLFGDATGLVASIDVGLASGSFSEDSGNVHIFIAYCPTHRHFLTLWSKAYVQASKLTEKGTTIRCPLVESEWSTGGKDVLSFEYPYVPAVDRAYVFSHLDEFGVTHNKQWNGKDDGVIWFDNVSLSTP